MAIPRTTTRNYTVNAEVTLDEIGKELGLTRERIRQIESTALKKLRSYCFTHSIEPQDMIDVLIKDPK